MNNIIDLLTDALLTDGGHHKQWYIEQVLILLVGEEVVRERHEDLEWEEGIAP